MNRADENLMDNGKMIDKSFLEEMRFGRQQHLYLLYLPNLKMDDNLHRQTSEKYQKFFHNVQQFH